MLTPQDIRARVLYRDAEVLVLDKPAGLAAHAARNIEDHLGLHMADLAFDASEPPRLAHRLDRDTAGCLALARTAWAATRLGRMFAAGHVAKTYWAVTEGVPEVDEGVVDLPVLKIRAPGHWAIVAHPDGQPARTSYRVLGRDGRRCWLEFTPHTGRSRQIRVHAAAIGCPLLGDGDHGRDPTPSTRLHLLARRLAFRLGAGHPAVVVVAAPPLHMAGALASCGWKAPLVALSEISVDDADHARA